MEWKYNYLAGLHYIFLVFDGHAVVWVDLQIRIGQEGVAEAALFVTDVHCTEVKGSQNFKPHLL
jgi:hypothetical protein